MSYVNPLGEDSWKLVRAFLWTLSLVPFLSADFALYPFVCSHVFNCMMSLASPSEHQTWGWSWGPWIQNIFYMMTHHHSQSPSIYCFTAGIEATSSSGQVLTQGAILFPVPGTE